MSDFKKRKLLVDKYYQPVERNFFYWLEHVVHWHLLLFALIAIITFAYLLFDQSSPTWASMVFNSKYYVK